ncbi:11180_t:CDS:2 [Entrophospora sp. SA101]|nr:11180_t:CDS:2 [Entrophospora sp. SA101]
MENKTPPKTKNYSKKLYKGNHPPLATIFLKPDPFSANISNILREKEQKYFKQKEILSVKEFQTRIQQRVHENSLYASVIIKEISRGVELMEIKYNDTIKRKLIIEWKDTILIHKIVIGRDFGMDKLTFQTIEEIENIIDNFFQMKIYEGFLTKGFKIVPKVHGMWLR